jgi:hypothetical protein
VRNGLNKQNSTALPGTNSRKHEPGQNGMLKMALETKTAMPPAFGEMLPLESLTWEVIKTCVVKQLLTVARRVAADPCASKIPITKYCLQRRCSSLALSSLIFLIWWERPLAFQEHPLMRLLKENKGIADLAPEWGLPRPLDILRIFKSGIFFCNVDFTHNRQFCVPGK